MLFGNHARRRRVIALVALLALPGLALAIVTGVDSARFAAAQREAAAIAAAQPAIVPLEGPIVVAVQPGHWKIDELPAEHARRNRGIGAVYAGVRELDINLAVVDALVPMIRARGWTAKVVPATVPPGLRADAFISIHADWGADINRNGWKLAPPWRPSPAASDLAAALRASFASRSELREDVGGITVGMRGYFGFASHRYTNASSPYTPAALVELGFVTNATERARMVSNPEYYAEIIMDGLERHFFSWSRSDAASLVPRVFETMRISDEGGAAFLTPDTESRVVRRLEPGEPGEPIRPVDAVDGWYEVRFRDPNQIAWIPSSAIADHDRLAAAPEEDGRGNL